MKWKTLDLLEKNNTRSGGTTDHLYFVTSLITLREISL